MVCVCLNIQKLIVFNPLRLQSSRLVGKVACHGHQYPLYAPMVRWTFKYGRYVFLFLLFLYRGWCPDQLYVDLSMDLLHLFAEGIVSVNTNDLLIYILCMCVNTTWRLGVLYIRTKAFQWDTYCMYRTLSTNPNCVCSVRWRWFQWLRWRRNGRERGCGG